MNSHQLFLSHIHEERDLAVLIKTAIEEEFSGFVEVFVSSDGTSIPAGSNFLKRIEDGLVNCIGALYLISPVSVKRNWINFELGAVWIRNAISIRRLCCVIKFRDRANPFHLFLSQYDKFQAYL
ncbi:hypothetical protein CWO23_12785, partial [Vibrio splendidus]|uniref:toll/interleukin-1 receptor domain-containing protein n=2 Tax=Vibrio splendidus TaxID=29497 RepID=UPI000D4A7684